MRGELLQGSSQAAPKHQLVAAGWKGNSFSGFGEEVMPYGAARSTGQGCFRHTHRGYLDVLVRSSLPDSEASQLPLGPIYEVAVR